MRNQNSRHWRRRKPQLTEEAFRVECATPGAASAASSCVWLQRAYKAYGTTQVFSRTWEAFSNQQDACLRHWAWRQSFISSRPMALWLHLHLTGWSLATFPAPRWCGPHLWGPRSSPQLIEEGPSPAMVQKHRPLLSRCPSWKPHMLRRGKAQKVIDVAKHWGQGEREPKDLSKRLSLSLIE